MIIAKNYLTEDDFETLNRNLTPLAPLRGEGSGVRGLER